MIYHKHISCTIISFYNLIQIQQFSILQIVYNVLRNFETFPIV